MTKYCESNNDKIQELLASGGFEPAIPTSRINRLDIWYLDFFFGWKIRTKVRIWENKILVWIIHSQMDYPDCLKPPKVRIWGSGLYIDFLNSFHGHISVNFCSILKIFGTVTIRKTRSLSWAHLHIDQINIKKIDFWGLKVYQGLNWHSYDLGVPKCL